MVVVPTRGVTGGASVRQLVLPVLGTGRDGTKAVFMALIDTGAMMNVVRRGSLSHLMERAKNPVRLVTASGEGLAGGDDELTLELTFKEKLEGGGEADWKTEAVFIEGEIEDEMILGYPWLAKNQVTIKTGDGKLMVENPPGELGSWWGRVAQVVLASVEGDGGGPGDVGSTVTPSVDQGAALLDRPSS